MNERGGAKDRIVAHWDRLRFGAPSSVEIRTDATEDMNALLQRRFRRAVIKHKDETGLIVVARFNGLNLAAAHGSRPTVRVRVGRRTQARHVSWRLNESIRTTTSWRSGRVRVRPATLPGLPTPPRWIRLNPGTVHLIEVSFSSTLDLRRAIFEVTLVDGQKKLLFVNGLFSSDTNHWYELRDI